MVARKLLGKTEDKPVSEAMKKKIEKLVDEHLEGSAFRDQLRRTVGAAFSGQNDEDGELTGSAYGLYIKKNRRPRKGGDLKEDLDYGEGLKKKRGRPATKKKRAFDPNSATARRAAVVKRVMKEQGLKLIAASSYVKAHNIPY